MSCQLKIVSFLMVARSVRKKHAKYLRDFSSNAWIIHALVNTPEKVKVCSGTEKQKSDFYYGSEGVKSSSNLQIVQNEYLEGSNRLFKMTIFVSQIFAITSHVNFVLSSDKAMTSILVIGHTGCTQA